MPTVTLVLEPSGRGARRALLATADALEAAHPRLSVRRVEAADLPLAIPWAWAPDTDVILAARPLVRPQTGVAIGLVPSWHVAPRWGKGGFDVLAVAHPDLVDTGVRRTGLARAAVRATGLPVPEPARADRAAARRQLGLPDAGDVVLIQAGGLDEDLLGRSLFQWTLLDPKPALLLCAAGDERTAAVLRRDAPTYGLDARLAPRAEDLPLLLAAADVAIVPPDGAAVAECHAAGTPVVVLGARAAAAGNRFLADRSAGVAVESVLTLAADLDTLRADRERLKALARGGRPLVRPGAAGALADLAAQAAEDPDALRGTQVETPPTPSPGPVLEDLGPAPDGPPSGVDASASLGAVRARLEQVRQRLGVWRERVELAVTAGAADLEEAARERVERYRDHEARLAAQAERLSRARPAAGARPRAKRRKDLESRFRDLEVGAALEALKRKLRGE